MSMERNILLASLVAICFLNGRFTSGFSFISTSGPKQLFNQQRRGISISIQQLSPRKKSLLSAGGFEYDEDNDEYESVENPYKNDAAVDADGVLKVDAARLLGPRLKGSSVYLVGMMGSGKSSVGNILAKRMGTYSFLDTDNIIESATGTTIPKIFEAEGEDGFRDVEAQVLDSVHAYVRCVISTGGGIVCRQMNWSKLQSGIVIWLNVEPEVIMSRIEGTDRPLLQTEDPLATLKSILEERRSLYEQADVHIEITADMDGNAVVDAIAKEMHEFIDNNPPAWKQAKEKAQSEGLDWVK